MIRKFLVAGVVAVVVVGLPYQLSSYWMHVADVALIYGIVALGLSITMGIAGQINLAQIAFFSAGAYGVAILAAHGWNFWVAGVAGLAAALLLGVLVSVPALRVQSHYLGIVTLGLALAVTNLITNLPVTGGAQGLLGLPAPPFFGVDLSSDYLYFYLESAVLLACLGAAAFVVRTRLGRRMRAMRDDWMASASIGGETPLLRITAFALGALFGGVAGVLYAGLIRYVSPDSFSVSTMFFILAAVIIGGRFSLIGSVSGAVALVVLREVLSNYSIYEQLSYGALVVLIVVFAPTGMAGVPGRLAVWLRRKRGMAPGAGGARVYQPVREPAGDGPPPAGEGEVPALSAEGVTKRFRGLVALSDVGVRVPPGQIRGIVGPNGSGKTTFFNVVSGLNAPSAGTVRIFGRRVSGRPAYRIAQLGVARTFQSLRLFARLSVRDNLLVALDTSRITWSWRYLLWPVSVARADARMRRECDALLQRYGLTGVASALPAELSYGTQRRVEIARAMARRPRLLLLDEPAAGLNGEEVRQLSEIVRDIRASGVTVVLIEHNMGLVMSLCDQITVFANGRVIAAGAPAQVARNRQVIEAYLGDSDLAGPPLTSEVNT